MNEQLALRVRRAACSRCKMADGATEVCVTATGPSRPDLLVVTKHHPGQKYMGELRSYLEAAGIDLTKVAFTAAIKCKNWDTDPGRLEIKACAPYLRNEVRVLKPKVVMTMGNEALQASLGRSGITKYRGRAYSWLNTQVVPTLSLGAIQRNPRELQGFVADLAYVSRLVSGDTSKTPPPYVVNVMSIAQLKELMFYMGQAKGMAYDVETTRGNEFTSGGKIVSLSVTLHKAHPMWDLITYAVPLYHPESPWRSRWKAVLRHLGTVARQPKRQVAHNGKFDQRWLHHYGMPVKLTFDTMLAVHTLDENMLKSLKTVARTMLGVDPWGIDTSDLLSTPLDEVLEYNALDAYYTWLISVKLRDQMLDQPRLAKLFAAIQMPASNVYTRCEQRGIWLDRDKQQVALKKKLSDLERIELEIMQWVPLADDAPTWPRNARGKVNEVNFNPSNFARWFLFEHIGLPVLGRGKTKPNGAPGDPSMREAIMLELKDDHPVVALLLERAVLVKHVQFLTAYAEHADDRDRLHTTFKLYGTVTGRTSSGKAGDDKLVGRAVNVERGVNLQQVPRDVSVRGVFGAPPRWSFIQADYSQVELRIIAFLSRDPVMLHLYQTGQDIHRATAATVLGVPASQVTAKDRKSAKAVGFGFCYGMSWRKFISTAFEKYDLRFTEEEAKAVRAAYFAQFAGLQPWHEKQRRLARQHRRVQSPLGRIRRLPDVDSQDREVRAEAERQAINSPVQSLASDLTVWAMVLVERRLRRMGLSKYAFTVGTVHDAINFEVRNDVVADVLPIVKDTMENLPIEETFGFYLDVPMISSLSLGQHWGGARELTVEEVYAWSA